MALEFQDPHQLPPHLLTRRLESAQSEALEQRQARVAAEEVKPPSYMILCGLQLSEHPFFFFFFATTEVYIEAEMNLMNLQYRVGCSVQGPVQVKMSCKIKKSFFRLVQNLEFYISAIFKDLHEAKYSKMKCCPTIISMNFRDFANANDRFFPGRLLLLIKK